MREKLADFRITPGRPVSPKNSKKLHHSLVHLHSPMRPDFVFVFVFFNNSENMRVIETEDFRVGSKTARREPASVCASPPSFTREAYRLFDMI